MSLPTPSPITNPRRLLLLGTKNSGKLFLLQSLTGSLPPLLASSAYPSSHAGLSHTLPLCTTYFTADIPVWIDELPAPTSSASAPSVTADELATTTTKDSEEPKSLELQTWVDGFLTPEARPVREALGAIILTIRKPTSHDGFNAVKPLLQAVGKVAAACGAPGYGSWDGTILIVAMPQSVAPRLEVTDDEWETMVGEELGMVAAEWVDFEAKGRGEEGEVRGLERVKEALECTDWYSSDSGGGFGGVGDLGEILGLSDNEGDEDTWGEMQFSGDGDDGKKSGGEKDEEDEDPVGSLDTLLHQRKKDPLVEIGDEMQREMWGLREAIEKAATHEEEDEEGQEKAVEELESIMGKLLAVREMGQDLPPDERRRMASKAIAELLKM
ncbi:hypothetical protein EX30DRAFT_337416 [Ascodesmis nigricans]|uniref:Increased recombination centers protein 6 n=1 Tax=Ascodesmis nigricans TaxID=341454 RepID=A0A4V3SJR5_9PEZI|nr:hypothetical protein EX30DRAFT_337416 [Ascodesmis nigricans]